MKTYREKSYQRLFEQRQEYQPEFFIGRKEEIQCVQEMAEQLPDRKRVVHFQGERGSGKTWLVEHLGTTLGEKGSISVHKVNLGSYREWDPIFMTVDIIRTLNSSAEGNNDRIGTRLSEMSRNMVSNLTRFTEDKGESIVLLVDGLNEVGWKHLSLLEDYFLGPLTAVSEVGIVTTNSGRSYPWKTPELRLNTLASYQDITPFSIEETKRQAEAVAGVKDERTVARMHEVSGGNPLVNLHLCFQTVPQTRTDITNRFFPGDLLRAFKEKGIRNTDNFVSAALDASSILRTFDEERLGMVLGIGEDYAENRPYREVLVAAGVARWESANGGYVLDEPLRRVVEASVKATQPERWEDLHQKAIEIYQDWADTYPRTRNRWQDETKYHRQKLTEVQI